MTLDTAMLLAAGIFLLIQGGFLVRWWIRRRRLHCPIVPTNLDSVINIDQWTEERRRNLAQMNHPAVKGYGLKKGQR